jgi:hypothetical protein
LEVSFLFAMEEMHLDGRYDTPMKHGE